MAVGLVALYALAATTTHLLAQSRLSSFVARHPKRATASAFVLLLGPLIWLSYFWLVASVLSVPAALGGALAAGLLFGLCTCMLQAPGTASSAEAPPS